ncbi:MAG TPA: transcriptional regulator [Firmicutes bacterium]|nr:transcriptional regulator [Bacillota bacterium]
MAKWPVNECECPMIYTLSVLGGKWKWLILYKLSESEVLRYGELRKNLPPITHKMLSQQLKELEAECLIHREEYHQIPPKVEYSLTAKGKTLMPVMELMSQWGKENRSSRQ